MTDGNVIWRAKALFNTKLKNNTKLKKNNTKLRIQVERNSIKLRNNKLKKK